MIYPRLESWSAACILLCFCGSSLRPSAASESTSSPRRIAPVETSNYAPIAAGRSELSTVELLASQAAFDAPAGYTAESDWHVQPAAATTMLDCGDVATARVDCGACDLTNACWLFGLDYLNWKPRQRGMDFAVAENGDALTVGSGRVHNLELDRDTGVRASIGYQTTTGWVLAVRYTYYDTDGNASVARPPGIGELFATRSHPDTNEEAEIATATADFDYKVFDIEASRSIYVNRFSDIRVFGGVRFADIGQRLRVDYDGRDFVNGVVATDMAMDSFGFQMGTEGHWRMARGFGLFGRVSTGLAHGRFDTSLFEANLDGIQLITDARDSYDQAVPVLELSGGVAWRRGGLEVIAGYEFSNWFNLSNRAALVDDIHEGLYGPFENDVLLEGLFARVSYSL